MRSWMDRGFSINEIVLIDNPPTFPQFGFSLGIVYFSKKERTFKISYRTTFDKGDI